MVIIDGYWWLYMVIEGYRRLYTVSYVLYKPHAAPLNAYTVGIQTWLYLVIEGYTWL